MIIQILPKVSNSYIQNNSAMQKKSNRINFCAQDSAHIKLKKNKTPLSEFLAQQAMIETQANSYPLAIQLVGMDKNGNKIGARALDKIKTEIIHNPELKNLLEFSKEDETKIINNASNLSYSLFSDNVEERALAGKKLHLITDQKLRQAIIKHYMSDFGEVKNALGFSLPLLQEKELINAFKNEKSNMLKEGIAANCRFIEDKKLRQSVESEFKNHRDARLRGYFTNNIFASCDPIRISKALKEKDSTARKIMAESINLIEEDSIRESVIEVMSKDKNEIREALMDSIYKREAYLQSIEVDKKMTEYSAVFDKNIKNLDESGLLSFINLAPVLKNIEILGLDKKEIQPLILNFNKILEFSLKNKDKFIRDKQASDKEIKEYFRENAPKIMNAILMNAKAPLNEKITQNIYNTTSFLNEIEALSKEKEIMPLLKKLLTPEFSNDSVDLSEKLKLINLSYGILQMGDKKALEGLLERMIENQKADSSLLNKELSLCLKKNLNLPLNSQTENLNEKIDFKYIHQLPEAFDSLNKSYQEKMHSVLNTAVMGDYSEFIFDPNSEVGRANLKTRTIFKENGIDFEKWLNYDKNFEFETKKGNSFSLEVWKRNPGFDIFIGSKAQNCSAMNAKNKEQAIDGLLNTFAQTIEIKDKSSTVGQIAVFWAKDDKDKLKLVVDCTSIAKKYRNDTQDLRENIVKYLKTYAKDITKKDFDILIGKVNHIFNSDNIKEKETRVKILGESISFVDDFPENKYYINSFKKNYWSNITSPTTALFYPIK